MTLSSSNRVREIECWFRGHEDGEFVVAAADHPSSVVGDDSGPRTVIYTTKVHCVGPNISALDVGHPVMIVGRYGLAVSTDLIHLEPPPVGASYQFLGDADPPDILAFAWLREHAPIDWLGVNDELLNRKAVPDRASVEIAMSESEKQAMHVLPDLCPDFRDLLGPCCAAALNRGFKIELEAAMIGFHQ